MSDFFTVLITNHRGEDTSHAFPRGPHEEPPPYINWRGFIYEKMPVIPPGYDAHYMALDVVYV